MSAVVDTKTMVHVGVELVLFCGLFFLIQRAKSASEEHIGSLYTKLKEHENLIQTQQETIERLAAVVQSHEQMLRQMVGGGPLRAGLAVVPIPPAQPQDPRPRPTGRVRKSDPRSSQPGQGQQDQGRPGQPSQQSPPSDPRSSPPSEPSPPSERRSSPPTQVRAPLVGYPSKDVRTSESEHWQSPPTLQGPARQAPPQVSQEVMIDQLIQQELGQLEQEEQPTQPLQPDLVIELNGTKTKKKR
jgi:hypothetical protein